MALSFSSTFSDAFGLWNKGEFSNVGLLVSKLSPGGGNPIPRICPAVDPLHFSWPWPPADCTGKQSALFYLQASSVPIGQLSQILLRLISRLQNPNPFQANKNKVNCFWHSKRLYTTVEEFDESSTWKSSELCKLCIKQSLFWLL